jgi:hypothetical protein
VGLFTAGPANAAIFDLTNPDINLPGLDVLVQATLWQVAAATSLRRHH